MARDIAQTDAYVVSWRDWRKVEMLFAHLKRNSTGYRCADQKESEKSCISPLQPRTLGSSPSSCRTDRRQAA